MSEEVRTKYGVPAEIGMAVSISCKEFTAGPWVVMGNIVGFAEDTGHVDSPNGKFSADHDELTYYNTDGDVIWSPDSA